MAPTIRTCNALALAALAAMLAGSPAAASTRDPVSPLSAYAQGRVLDATGLYRDSAIAYGIALAAEPGDTRIAIRAFRQAVEAGDRRLALRAARALEAGGAVADDARILLFVDELERGNWRGAHGQLDRIDQAGGFAFLVPHFRAWLRVASRDGDPLAELDSGKLSALSGGYARETRALVLAALGRVDDAAAAAKALSIAGARSSDARVALAARLQRSGRTDAALPLLPGEEGMLAEARTVLESGQPLGTGVADAGAGVAFLLARLASDIAREGGSQAALSLARLARFADDRSPFAALAVARALSGRGHDDEALSLLASVGAPFESEKRDLRFEALRQSGRMGEALAEAETAAGAKGATLADLARLGDVHAALDRPEDAAKAYRAAIARAGNVPAAWNLWLLLGASLDKANDWTGARTALKKAVELGPDQPGALNHLGYSMLERGDDPVEATRYIARANMLRPDDAAITDSLGWALFLRGRTAEAIALLEQAVAAGPGEPVINEHLGDAYWKAGRRVEARYAWRAAHTQSEGDDDRARLMTKIANGPPAPR